MLNRFKASKYIQKSQLRNLRLLLLWIQPKQEILTITTIIIMEISLQEPTSKKKIIYWRVIEDQDLQTQKTKICKKSKILQKNFLEENFLKKELILKIFK